MKSKYKVYIHTFPNNKKYIGLTSLEVNQRWQGGRGYKNQKLMYRAILKWGWRNIKHFVYEVETESEMKYLEKYLIAYYQTTNPKYGYNVSTGGENGSGLGKPIDQYDKQGNFIRTWDSIKSAGEEMNWSVSAIANCVRKLKPTAYNFYGFYAGEKPVFKTYKTCRKVYQYSLTGELIAEYKNAAEAARYLGKESGNIVSCCNGKRKSAYKFIGKYEC